MPLTNSQQAYGTGSTYDRRQYNSQSAMQTALSAPSLQVTPIQSSASAAQDSFNAKYGGLTTQQAIDARSAQVDKGAIPSPAAPGMSPMQAGLAEATQPGFHNGTPEPGIPKAESGGYQAPEYNNKQAEAGGASFGDPLQTIKDGTMQGFGQAQRGDPNVQWTGLGPTQTPAGQTWQWAQPQPGSPTPAAGQPLPAEVAKPRTPQPVTAPADGMMRTADFQDANRDGVDDRDQGTTSAATLPGQVPPDTRAPGTELTPQTPATGTTLNATQPVPQTAQPTTPETAAPAEAATSWVGSDGQTHDWANTTWSAGKKVGLNAFDMIENGNFWTGFWTHGIDLPTATWKGVAEKLVDPATYQYTGNYANIQGDIPNEFIAEAGKQGAGGKGLVGLASVGTKVAKQVQDLGDLGSYEAERKNPKIIELEKIKAAMARYGVTWEPDIYRYSPPTPGGGDPGTGGTGGSGESPFSWGDFPLNTESPAANMAASPLFKLLVDNPKVTGAAEMALSQWAQDRAYRAQGEAWNEAKAFQAAVEGNENLDLADQLARDMAANPNPVDYEAIKNREASDIAKGLQSAQSQLGASAARRGVPLGAVTGMSSELARLSGNDVARRMGELETQKQMADRAGQAQAIDALTGSNAQRLQAQGAASQALQQILMGAAPNPNPIGGATDLAAGLEQLDLLEGQIDDAKRAADKASTFDLYGGGLSLLGKLGGAWIGSGA